MSSKEDAGYEFLCTSLEGFVARVVKNAAQNGYYFYKLQKLGGSSEPTKLDEKLLSHYAIRLTKDQRYYRKRQGRANLMYSRWERFFVVQATSGKSKWYQEEGGRAGTLISDIRRRPLRIGGYSISLRKDGAGYRARVRIDSQQYRLLRATFLELALRRDRASLERAVWNIEFEPYAPVYRQIRGIVEQMNSVRKKAGLELLRPSACVRRKRNLVKHCGENELGRNLRYGAVAKLLGRAA